MNRTILLAVLCVILGGSAWYSITRNNKDKKSALTWDMAFAVENTDQIGKVFIADHKGRNITLEKKSGRWLCNGQYPVRPSALETFMTTLSKIEIWFRPSPQGKEQAVKSLSAEGIKVEIYDTKNELIKTYYVGGVTPDEKGTFFIMEGAEQPYVVRLQGLTGQVRVRYMLNEDDWRDRTVFAEKPENIAAISVEYPQQKSESFRLNRIGEAQYEVLPFFSTTRPSTAPLRKGVAEAYILKFESISSETFLSHDPVRDSVTALVPFAIVTLKNLQGKQKTARFWPVEVQQSYRTGQNFILHYYTEIDSTDFVVTQHHLFGPIFRGYSFFYETRSHSSLQ